MICISIVSHGQASLVENLLQDFVGQSGIEKIIITHNLTERAAAIPSALLDRVTVIYNTLPKGFSSNHNHAAFLCNSRYFLVLNPDIRIRGLDLADMCCLMEENDIAVMSPVIFDEQGQREDSARYFPTLLGLLRKAIIGDKGTYDRQPDDRGLVYPDWIGGMFMCFDFTVFQKLGGFDDTFYMYYEDVDICARLWALGGNIAVNNGQEICHSAQRKSHRSLLHFKWHVTSILRYFSRRHLYSIFGVSGYAKRDLA